MKNFLVVSLLVISQINISIVDQPEWMLWGNPAQITYDAAHHEWINKNWQYEGWAIGTKYAQPEHVPAKPKLKVELRQSQFTKPEVLAGAILGLPKRRFVLVNVESVIVDDGRHSFDPQYRVWPHLGLLYVGTVADQEGYEVMLWDELVQGQVNLSKLVQSGDIVGFSLVVTGIERGVDLARQAKQLGARYVIAGNDSAAFRANQLLAMSEQSFDAIFISNSLTPVRDFFRQASTVPLAEMRIAGMQTELNQPSRSNDRQWLIQELQQRRNADASGRQRVSDVFIVPNFNLFPDVYWQEVWRNYRTTFGHKHRSTPTNAMSLFAQGCTRAAAGEACSFCTITDVANVQVPSPSLLAEMIEAYRVYEIDTVFNTTDSIYEMRPALKNLQQVGARFNAMSIYGRAWGLAHHPELLDEWLGLVNDRLLINVGMDSGDERMLSLGVVKTFGQTGSRLDENRRAVEVIKRSGAHLHYSLIFGSPGEDMVSCERSIEFLEWTIATLGSQLDLVETDVYWLNYGAPASRVFSDYAYAEHLASLSGQGISREEWQLHFGSQSDALVVPITTEEAWYRNFTRITYDQAQSYNDRAAAIMARHTGSIRGRAYKPVV